MRPLLYGTLAVGVLDGLDAVVFYGLRGVGAARVFQGVASGLLGRAAFYGGAQSALLGVAVHFTIAFGVVWTCTQSCGGSRSSPKRLSRSARFTGFSCTPS